MYVGNQNIYESCQEVEGLSQGQDDMDHMERRQFLIFLPKH